MNYDYFPERLQPCYLLRESDIPCVVWFEDAVRYYGVPVVLHALHVLVSDINEAAEVLVRKDWTLITQAPKKIGNAFVDTALHCLRPPNLKPVPPPSNMKPLGPTTTILLPATDWNWTISERREGSYSGDIARTFFPPLPQLLDAMIDSELDVPPSDAMLRLHISCMIGYLHDYVPAVKTREFVEELRYDNRQYHLDWLSGMSTATNSFIKHQRAIRDALRQGTYQLQECSASSDNEDLFIEKKLARFIAKYPPSEEVSGIEDEEPYVYDISEYDPKDIRF